MKKFLFKPSNFKMFMSNAVEIPGLLVGIFGVLLVKEVVFPIIGIAFVTIGVLWFAWSIAYAEANKKR